MYMRELIIGNSWVVHGVGKIYDPPQLPLISSVLGTGYLEVRSSSPHPLLFVL